ncbi:MAG: ExbD/TolR family protein [Panacagrimonas sp.]
MKMTRRVRRMERMHKFGARTVHLNIVSMIDVFAVLVFFLLVSSSLAAARLNVINLNLPSPDRTPEPQDQELQLTATVRQGYIEVSDRNGAVRNIVNTPGGYNLGALSELLVEVKKAAPTEQNVTLLMEPDVVYDDVIKLMDVIRITPAEARASGLPPELFPNISIGEAAKLGAGAVQAP